VHGEVGSGCPPDRQVTRRHTHKGAFHVPYKSRQMRSAGFSIESYRELGERDKRQVVSILKVERTDCVALWPLVDGLVLPCHGLPA
jgi:hypothetical protein